MTLQLDWSGAHVGASRSCYAGRRYVAQAVHYDVPTPHWRAFINGRLEPVAGVHETAEAAQTAAELELRHHEQRGLAAEGRSADRGGADQ